jgi:hypothetical protein
MADRRYPGLRAVALAALVVTAVASAAAGAPARAAGQTGGIGLQPCTYSPDNPTTRSYFIPTVKPGETYANCVWVSNLGTAPVSMYVNAVDGITSVTSGAVFANRPDPVRRWGSWVTPSVNHTTVAAQSRTKVDFQVKVPGDASPGDHLAGLAFEPDNPSQSGGQVSIITVVRTVMSILVEVPGDATGKLAITQAEILPYTAGGTASLSVTVADTGLKLIKPKLVFTVDGPNGYHRTIHRDGSCPPDKANPNSSSCPPLDTVLPGDSIVFPFPWPDDLGAGAYTLTIEGTCDQGCSPVSFKTKFTLDKNLNRTKEGVLQTIVDAPATAFWKTPLFWGFVVVLTLLSLVLLFFLVIRPRRHRAITETDPRTKAEIRNRLHNL